MSINETMINLTMSLEFSNAVKLQKELKAFINSVDSNTICNLKVSK